MKVSGTARGLLGAMVAAAGLAALSPAAAQVSGQSVVTSAQQVKWGSAGVPGVSIASVDGDQASGASHFFLKYAAGMKTPLHYHSADHHVVTVGGNLVLVVDGRDHVLAPGSYFLLKNKTPHAARCEGSQDCVMFIDARAAWDVVPVAK